MKSNPDQTCPPVNLTARLQLVIALALWLGSLSGLLAQGVPDQLNYQGILLDGQGKPVTGFPNVQFRIWDTPMDSNPSGLKWGRTFRIAPDTNGAFNVVLSGEGALLTGAPDVPLASVFTNSDPRYLELTVEGSQAIKPRQQFVTAPYTFLAANARSLNQRPPEDYFLPAGLVMPFAGAMIAGSEPTGWLLCDGRAVSRTGIYKRLFDAVGTAWGAGDGSTTFNLPDLRGMFLRGVNGGLTGPWSDPDATSRVSRNSGNAGDKVGSIQGDGVPRHTHIWGQSTTGSDVERKLQSWPSSTATSASDILQPFYPNVAAEDTGLTVAVWDWSMKVATASQSLYTKPDSLVETSGETRPNNAYVNYLIKY